METPDLDDIEANPRAAQAVMSIMASIVPIRDAIIGYRRSLVEHGYSEHSAEVLASQMHAALVDRAFRHKSTQEDTQP